MDKVADKGLITDKGSHIKEVLHSVWRMVENEA